MQTNFAVGRRRFAITCLFAFAAMALAPRGASADGDAGQTIYATRCASCHGAHGEGTKKQPKRLAGDRSVAQLADVIAKTMPEDEPGLLTPVAAEAVAKYIYGAFYSPVARERNRPARVELARLTVPQYRQALTDLLATFRQPSKWDSQPGLKAEYFKGREFRDKDRVEKRIDPQVRFDFGVESPLADSEQAETEKADGEKKADGDNKTGGDNEADGDKKPAADKAAGEKSSGDKKKNNKKIEAHQFLIRWNGSLLAPETGDYEFVIHTEHAARLWINDLEHPLIDAWVKSGSDTEYRGSLFLLAGRPYPLRLEFAKGKKGVDDSAKEKKKPPPVKASIVLAWKRPHGVEEPIARRHFSTADNPELYVCATHFPPDDRSYGWDRGTTVSKEWDQATTDAAIEVAGYVAERLNRLAGTRDDAGDRDKKLRSFCRRFVERAFRGPLAPDVAKTYIDDQFAATGDPALAVKRVVLLTLKSPRFLYREIGGEPDAYAVASRLSFGLWDSLPDQELLTAAAKAKLSTPEQVTKQAERMLGDLRAKSKLHRFLLTWLRIDQPRDIAKDATRFPGFDDAVIADLRTSLELFVDGIVGSEKSDFRQLFLSDEIPLNGRLAKFYGVDLPADADFTDTKLDADQRAGVLTHPYLLSRLADRAESSPIHRGVFLARGILAVSLKPPPDAVAPLSPELQPTLNTRERVTLQTRNSTCSSCHGIINPLGFTLEHFDAVGRYRDQDNGKPVDASGSYRTRTGKSVTLQGARELAAFLVESDESQTAFVEQLFHDLVQQPVRAYGPTTLDELRKSFAANGFSVRKLAAAVMAETALQGRTLPASGKAASAN